MIDPTSNRTFETIADTFRAGCVALVNRSTTHKTYHTLSISEQLAHESDFFLHHSGMSAFLSSPPPPSQLSDAPPPAPPVTLNDIGHSCLGLPALLSRIDIIVRCPK